MVSVRNIINWNNRGVSLFERSQWDEASEFFLLALEGIMECHCAALDDNDAESEVAWASNFAFRGWSQSPNKMKDFNNIHLFSRTIVLNHYDGVPPRAILASYAAALRYNKALCLHLSIIHRSEVAINDEYSPFEIYDEYVLCYNYCFQQPATSSSSTSITHITILFLALVNNMGAILHNDMARFHDASNCLEAAYAALSQIHKKELSIILDDKEISKLSTNLLVVPKSTTPAA
mmetsp:Transcript_4970/g.7174  ORF Transcript_4970/g.7174 Transcript_4970/m.7174 type:complete len:234 (+) Transcript_4970:75-776(+)